MARTKAVRKQQCEALTKKGERCKKCVKAGTTGPFCATHAKLPNPPPKTLDSID